MLYLIGLGLNERGISLRGIKALKKCKKVYLEGYTVDFPYTVEKLDKILKKKIIVLERDAVESDNLVNEAKKENIALLVYGSPLFATTHMSLISEAREKKVKTRIVYAASVYDAVAETGLQLYKFGKIASMPKWEENYEPYSFLEPIQSNQLIKAHSLILIDIGLSFKNALNQLEKAVQKRGVKLNLDKILVCSRMGSKDSRIIYGDMNKLKKQDVLAPFCFIIPGDMHFLEKEVVEGFQ